MKAYSQRNRTLLMTGLLVVMMGAVYLSTLLPGVGYFGDTAKFQLVGKVLGTPHETGYPTYVLLNHFFTQIFPFGSQAYKANLFSAVLAITAVIFLFHTLLLLNIDRYIAFISSLTFGLSYTLWSQSVVAEVYTLNIFFVAAVIFFLLKWHIQGDSIYFYSAAALYALSFGNHLTVIFLLPAFIYIVWVTDRQIMLRPKAIAIVALFILIGAGQYSYLLWRASDPHPLYTEVSPHNLDELWYVVSGGRFRGRMFAFTLREIIQERLPLIKPLLSREFSFLLLFSILGVATFKKKQINYFFLLGFFGYFIFALNYNVEDVYVFFIPAYYFLFIYLAQGLSWINSSLPSRFFYKRCVFAVIPLLLLLANFPLVDQSHNTANDLRVRAILDVTGQDALIVPETYSEKEFVWYYLLIENWQSDHNIYVDILSDKVIAAYLRQDTPFYLKYQQRDAPVGLTVYVGGQPHKENLEDMGFAVEKVMDNLYRVTEN